MFKPDTLQNSLAGGKRSYKSENIQDPFRILTAASLVTLVSKEVLAGTMQKQLNTTLLLGISEMQNTALKKWGKKTKLNLFFAFFPTQDVWAHY